MFGKYRIISILGTGSSSTVYLAEHLKLNVYRAIKCIPKSTVTIHSLSSEVHLLKNLKHPGIPIIFDVDEDNQFVYIIEEYIQGESLDTFVLHQDNISQEHIIKFGIQLCDILDYLHHLMPYPILYQDLKPEHIIVCGEQLKLIDFGISFFFTGSNSNSQFFGTEGFAAPEVIAGKEITTLSDIYSLGKVLLSLLDVRGITCSKHFISSLEKACAFHAADRYETVNAFKSTLEKELNVACPDDSHLIDNIIVIGSKHGIGTTHVAISLVSFLNQIGHSALYVEKNNSDNLRNFIRNCKTVKEENGIYIYNYFHGIPNYGSGVSVSISTSYTRVKDYGVYSRDIIESISESILFFVFSGSEWDLPEAILTGQKLMSEYHVIFICNYNNKKAAKKFAHALGCTVFCFPMDSTPFYNTKNKHTFFSTVLSTKRGKQKFFDFIIKKRNIRF